MDKTVNTVACTLFFCSSVLLWELTTALCASHWEVTTSPLSISFFFAPPSARCGSSSLMHQYAGKYVGNDGGDFRHLPKSRYWRVVGVRVLRIVCKLRVDLDESPECVLREEDLAGRGP